MAFPVSDYTVGRWSRGGRNCKLSACCRQGDDYLELCWNGPVAIVKEAGGLSLRVSSEELRVKLCILQIIQVNTERQEKDTEKEE
jgi:hypothetical protein